jgi:hypothetical protein
MEELDGIRIEETVVMCYCYYSNDTPEDFRHRFGR